MAFSRPLLLLVLVPLAGYFLWLGWPRHAAGGRQRAPGIANPRQTREIAALALRLALVTALVLALAGAQIVRASDDLAVVFLLDFSDSVGQAGRDFETAYVAEALAQMRPNDRAGIVVFGADAVVDRQAVGTPSLGAITSVVRRDATDLAEAIRLGLALFPAGSAQRLVLLSDGAQTVHQDDARRAAQLAAATGVRIDVVPLAREGGPEALVSAVDVPPRLHQGEDFSLGVTLSANDDMRAHLRAFAAGSLVVEQDVQLHPGSNAFVLPMRAGVPGFTPFRVQIEPERDTYFQNNALSAFSLVTGPPRVLLVAGAPAEGDALYRALTAAGLDIARAAPAEMPSDLAALSRHSSIVLVNTPAGDFSNRQLLTLQSFVRDLGGGLVAVGGPHSYGVGGWFLSPLEETLPVDMQVKDPKRFPAIAFAVVIDESGSMAATENGIAKYRLAAEAAARVAEFMHDFDELTVIGFDTQPTVVIGPVAGTEKAAAIPQIMSIGPGGGGIYIHDSLQFAFERLKASEKPNKHIILLADASDSEQQEGARELAQRIRDANITISVVGIGNPTDSDVAFQQDIAAIGGGRFHLTSAAATLPTIFAQEAAEVQRSYIVEEPFNVTLQSQSPILQGIGSAPQLLGYVATSPKPAAQVVLAAPMTDPVLAQWQYGLGRSVAFTSDATGRWATQWITWEQFARFWSQAVRWTIREDVQQTLEPRVEYGGETAQVTVDALDNLGATLNGMSLTLRLVTPSMAASEVQLRQTAPGRYSGEFTPGEEGAYLMGLSGTLPDGQSVVQAAGWVNPYSAEYRLLESGEAGEATLRGLAAPTGGGPLESPAAAFVHDLRAQRASQEFWPWLLLFAAILLPIDVAVRRLVITRYEVEKAWARVGGAFRLPGMRRPAPERPPEMAQLFQAKARAEQPRPGPGTAPPAPPAPGPEPSPAPPAPTAPAAPPPPRPAAPPQADGGDTLAARLLKKKRSE